MNIIALPQRERLFVVEYFDALKIELCDDKTTVDSLLLTLFLSFYTEIESRSTQAVNTTSVDLYIGASRESDKLQRSGVCYTTVN